MISDDLKNLGQLWYNLDQNHISADHSDGIYILKNLNTKAEEEVYWNDVYPKLLKLLDGLPFDMENQDLLINRSVTEYEVKIAMKKDDAQKRILWFYRKFLGGITQSDEKYWDYNDTLSGDKKKYYDDLIDWMKKEIPADRVRRYEDCSYESYVKKDSEWTRQWAVWCEDITEALRLSLQNIIQQRRSWDQDGCGLGV